MRILTAIILAAFAATALAEPSGVVESIGLNNTYRPGCWTPMRVRIKPSDAPSGTYQIQIKQRDLDNDIQVFTRNISLTGAQDSKGAEQRFWVYFIPQPTNRGLPSLREGGTVKDIQELLEVYLCSESGKQIAQLRVSDVPENVDPPSSAFSTDRGCRLVLVVNDGGSQIVWEDYRAARDQRDALLGVLENTLFLPLRANELPDLAIAYDAVDAVLWLDADPGQLKADGGLREQALEGYIRNGGHLVIGQSANWQQTLGFGNLLPVALEEIEFRDDPEPLRSLARSSRSVRQRDPPDLSAWDSLKGPFRLAVATPRENAIVDQWMILPTAGRRPFIARQVVGCGAVSWVAQDPGDRALQGAKSGWVNIWDHLFDWRNDPASGRMISDQVKEQYAAAQGVDFGAMLTRDLERKGRVGLFITLAVVFFILYWLAAGPGVFLYLTGRKQAHLSWFSFAAVALLATVFTVGVVKLLLRGPPEMTHLSIVRGDRGEEGTIRSRFGLYIPRDGNQEIALAQPAGSGYLSNIAALPIHPAHLRGELDTVGKLSYRVPVSDPDDTGAATLDVPYRSTLKQFESRWGGSLSGRIEGSATIGRAFNDIEGRLTNGTNRDLRNVYIAYKVQLEGRSEDWMLYLPEWKSGVTLDLKQECYRGADQAITPWVGVREGDVPGRGKVLMGRLSDHWPDLWYSDMRGITQLETEIWTEPDGKITRAWPLLTFFDRLPPSAVTSAQSRGRSELLRRGARMMDLSAALAAGGLVIVADTAPDSPMPVGLKVDGDEVAGTGRIVYQFVLPVKRKAVEESQDIEAATQPN